MKTINYSPSLTPGKENILQEGHCVRNRWHIIKKIGQGAFGEVYHCRDKKDDTEVAIKIVSKEKDSNNSNAAIQILKLEVSILRAIQAFQGQGFFPRFKAYGKTMRFDYLAMELLGPSLSELRRSQPHRKFSLSTTLRLGEMMLRCIRAIHRAGYVHRDVKPSNFVMGIGKNSRKVYLLDFGLSRQYLLENGELRPARPKASFQGTPRYASINVLNHREAGRQDDLISLFYVLSEFTFQELPWKNFRELTDVAYAKETFDHQLLVSEFPDEFHDYFSHISDLTYEDEPDYEMLLSLFERSLQRRGVRDSDPLDFEVDDVTPFVNLQNEEHPQSARTQSDVHVVKSELDNPVMAEERLDNMNHQMTSSNQVGGSCVLDENSEKKIIKNITNISINSNNVYSSCKDTGFSISPNGNPTFASVNTDVESPVSNDPKNKLLCQPITDLKKAISSPHNDSMDSLLKESATIGRNTTDKSQLTLKPFPQLAPQVIKRINLAIPLPCSKTNKPEKKEKRRHSVRRSVSQPARTRANLNVVSHHALLSVPLMSPSRGAERGLLPRCWSCPTISLFIRSDLRPPLKQQASFEENIYEVDVMRNVAASRKAAEDIVQSRTARRNSLPSVLDLKTPIGHFASEQELTRRDADIYDGSLENNASCMRGKRNPASTGLKKVKKSLSDTNVVGYKTSKHLRITRPLTPVDSSKLTQLLPDGHRSETPEINAPVSSNYSLSKSPTFKNYADNCKTNQESQKGSNEQETYTTPNNSAFSDNFKGLANHAKDGLKNNATEKYKNPPVDHLPVTTLEGDSLDHTKHKEADIRCQIKDPSQMLENSKRNQMPTNINAGLEIDEPPLQKENERVPIVNNIVTKNITSEPVGEFLNSTTENTRRNSEDTAVKVSQSKKNILKTFTKSSDTHTQVQSNEQENSGSRNKSSHQSETGSETENVHRLEKQKSQLNIPEVVINNASEISLSGSSLSKSFQGNKVEENHASSKLSHSEEVNHVQPSKEQNSLTSAISTKAPLQGTSKAVHDSGTKISERNLSGIENDVLDLSEKENCQMITPEVVIINDAEGRTAESFQPKNKINFSEKGSSQKSSCAKVDLSSLQCEEIISPQAVPSFNNCINTVDNCSFPNLKDPLLEEHKKFDVPKTNGLPSERVVSEPANKLATTSWNKMIEISENIPSESKSLAKQNITVDSNKCNEIFDSFEKNTNTDIINNDKSCEILTKPPRSVSILSANVNNSKNSQLSENKLYNTSETEINNFVCESNGSYSNKPPNSLSESLNISQKNHHVPTKDVSNSLQSNVSKETGEFFQNNLYPQLSDQEHENSSLKNSPKTGDSGFSEKQIFNLPISNTLPCDSNENFSKNRIVKGNASEQISNTLIPDSNTKLCKSKSVSSIELKRNLSPSTAPKEKAISQSRDCNQKEHLFLKTDSNLADMVESDVKNMAVKECVSPNINESSDLLQQNSSDTILPKNNASKAELCISKSDPKSTIEHIEDTTPRNNRRQRQNSDSKYAKDEKDLNLNFTRRRHRPVSQIYEDAEEFSSFPSASIVQSPSDNSVCDLLQPPPGDPPPNHCLPSRRMRYRSLTSSTSSS